MGKYAIPATLAFLGAYIAVEAYYAGQRDGKTLVKSADLPADTDETDTTPESQQETGE